MRQRAISFSETGRRSPFECRAPSPEPRAQSDFLTREAEFRQLVALLHKVGRSKLAMADVEDAVCDTILLLLEARSRLAGAEEDIEDVPAMAVTILKRRASNMRRDALVVPQLASNQLLESVAASREDVTRGSQGAGFRRLPSMGRRQRLIVETILDGGSVADAAEKLGAPQKEVARTMRRLVARLMRSSDSASQLPPKVTRTAERRHEQSAVDLLGGAFRQEKRCPDD